MLGVNAKQKIVLIIVYMGKAPFWMPAFLLSCRNNPDVQWLIYSDITPPKDCPHNVGFINMNLDSFNRLASQKLKRSIRIDQNFVYKICDMKSAFGVIFEQDIRRYDFWGHCDIDIVWGKIRNFIDGNLLNKYDILTSRTKRISGHFCIFRNTEDVNLTYSWIPGIKRMMNNSNIHHKVDEDHMTDYLHVHLTPNFLVRVKQFFWGKQPIRPRVYWDRVLAPTGAHQREMGSGAERCWWWKDGRTFDSDGREMMYLHFHKIKQTMKSINFGYGDRPKEFMITREGIFAP